MKTKLIALAAAMLATAGVTAHGQQTFEYGVCGSEIDKIYGGVDVAGVALQLTAEEAAQLEGCKVVGMKVGGGDGVGMITPFVAHRFGADTDRQFLTKKQVSLSNMRDWNEVTFTTPYTITPEEFFIGFFCAVPSGKRLIATDGAASASPRNWAGFALSTDEMWKEFAPYTTIGNFSIRLIIEGDKLPADELSVNGLEVEPVLRPGEPFELGINVTGRAYDGVSSLSGSVTVADQEPVPFTFDLDTKLAYGENRIITVGNLVCNKDAARVDITATVDKINGADNPSAQRTVSTFTSCSDNAFLRNVVVEEGTGTWCINCVYGIAGFEYMRETYTDGSFIGIALHNGETTPDPMQQSVFLPLVREITDNGSGAYSYPTATANRSNKFFPTKSSILENYENMHKPAYACVEIKASYATEARTALVVNATTRFAAAHDDIEYVLGFVVTEDNVGPYSQANGAAGSGQDYGGFEDMPNPCPVMFNDVARSAVGLYGLDDSLITSAQAGDAVEYMVNVPLENVAKVENSAVTALLLDRKTGEIVNAMRVFAKDYGSTSVIVTGAADTDAPVEYYNLQGVRIDTPARGQVVIRRQGTVVEKVVF